MIVFSVLGIPSPQGNKSAFPFQRKDGSLGVSLREGRRPGSAEAFKSWRKSVANAASMSMQDRHEQLIRGPVVVDISFYVLRPKNATKKLFPASRPDLDKYVRCVCDALTKVVYEDDGRIISLQARKRFADSWSFGQPGAFISVRAAESKDLTEC